MQSRTQAKKTRPRLEAPSSIVACRASQQSTPSQSVSTQTVTTYVQSTKTVTTYVQSTKTVTTYVQSATAVTATATYAQSPPTNVYTRTSTVLSSMSQLPEASRKTSRSSDVQTGDRPMNFDPEQFNPDGSIHAVHTLPNFDHSYAQALKTRYIRHRDRAELEKELSLNEIFGKETSQ